MNDEVKFKTELKSFRRNVKHTKHLYPALSPLTISAGCNYIRETANAHWLFDDILRFQDDERIKNTDFQVWKLRQLQRDLTWELSCYDDSKKPPLLTKKYESRDFPTEELIIWVFDRVAILPEDY